MLPYDLRWLKYFALSLVLSVALSYVVFMVLFGLGWLCGFGMGPPLLCMSLGYASVGIPIVIFIVTSVRLFKRIKVLDFPRWQAFLIAVFHFLMLPLIYFSWHEYGLYKQRKAEALGRQKAQELTETVQRNVQIQPLSYEIEPGTRISNKSGVFYVDTLEVRALVTLKQDPLFEGKRAKLCIQEEPSRQLSIPIGYLGFEKAKDNFNTYRRSSESNQQFKPLPEGDLFLLPDGKYEVSVLCEYCLRRPADQNYPELYFTTHPYSLGLYLGGWTTAAVSAPLSNLEH